MTTLARQRTKGEWIVVTPKMASEWINMHNNTNRKLREGVVEKYARDMKTGNWTRNPQPIMFYDDGQLADGQHRLWAVIECKTPIEFFVQHGIERENALNIDTGLGRNVVDNASISGYTGYITNQAVAVAIMLHHGKRISSEGKVLSNHERLMLVEKYAKHLQFVDSIMPTNKKLICTTPIRAAMARAHMHEGDNSRLTEFGQVLGSGMPKHAIEDKAALALRLYMTEIAADRKLDPRDTFLKAMNAIWYFMKRKPITIIRVVKDEAYPLPK